MAHGNTDFRKARTREKREAFATFLVGSEAGNRKL